ncbi:NNP family nitrate/nitrite transporter-like MFS transporter [Saccharopolyspora lacisalsi]|uniref:NNP family nitrate/nitrite transporter-like MFS transporter n=1 Tax=Halosaccharopolyspora lacisalsi TaxID=1000566 RepID=A0A839DV48_9PSEU|nr:nitrate/nitrite transporter [Halosaccharopolyspora lacisalsi]MBA8825364.1 NNP family nitrate/nitrite transporter-like MFS transporter [Halosaccharopolyspora lacisalsi]
MTTTSTPPARWIEGWDPEDEAFWQRSGRRIARRNLLCSVFSEHIGFSVWSIWSVMVLFMSPDIGLPFSASQKFLLVMTPTLVGAVLRLPYSAAVTRFGGRRWTVFSSAVLLVPTLLACYFVRQPGTPLWVFVLIGAFAGLGGGNFGSSMTNVTALFPQRHQGWALGLNAGGGNIAVAVIQLVGLLVIATVGNTHPSLVAAIYLPLIVLAALAAAQWMDDVDAVGARHGGLREAASNPHTWWTSLLYVGTFGSFIGYGFAFGLVLQTEFDFSPLRAASYTFLGPLLGSLARPLGGWLADRWGGARVTLVSFLLMVVGTGMLLVASAGDAFPLFLVAFSALFVLAGVGNGSTYKMIPAIAAEWVGATGRGSGNSFTRARRLSGGMLGITGAVGALGGVFINLVFRDSYGDPAGSGVPAFVTFIGFYLVCVVVTWVVYLRPASWGKRDV